MEKKHQPLGEVLYSDVAPEIRSLDGGGRVVFGYWAIYNSRSREMRTAKGVRFTESISPGAFDQTDFSDVCCCFDHSEAQFLASEPTLRHGVDSRGAWYEYDHDPSDPVHVTALQRIVRGNAKGSSFQFPGLAADCFDVQDGPNGVLHVTIRKFPRVLEFGPVRLPAYSGTSAMFRNLDLIAQADTPDPLLLQRTLDARRLLR